MKYFIIGLIGFISLLLYSGVRTYESIQFDRKCGSHLKRAADANTVDLAQKELDITLNYMKKNDLTEGYTSILYTTPDEDVGFWYTNIKSTRDELDLVTSETTQLEKSNLLIKLRETLLDAGEQGKMEVTIPDGISIFPHNVAFAFWGWLSSIMLVIGIISIVMEI